MQYSRMLALARFVVMVCAAAAGVMESEPILTGVVRNGSAVYDFLVPLLFAGSLVGGW